MGQQQRIRALGRGLRASLIGMAALLVSACAPTSQLSQRLADLELPRVELPSVELPRLMSPSRGAAPTLLAAQPVAPHLLAPEHRIVDIDPLTPAPQVLDWRDHFKSVRRGAILVQLDKRRLSYWGPGGETYREFPIGTPRSEELTRVGRTKIVRKRKDPDWRPTPAMLKRNPELPAYVPPGPDSPMGSRAMYLGWTYYAIHGTNIEASVGRATTSGCFRLHDNHVKWLYDHAQIGAPVLVVHTLDNV